MTPLPVFSQDPPSPALLAGIVFFEQRPTFSLVTRVALSFR